jgi:hypothetical protein
MYLRAGAALRSGPNLYDPVVIRPTQWLPIQAAEACDRWNCRVWYDLATKQVVYARRSRVELDRPSGVTIGSDGKPIVAAPPPGTGTGPGKSPGTGPGYVPPPGERAKLVRGDEGADVSAVQELLVRRGYQIKVDGKYGPATEEAVRQFQRANGLNPDGRVGPLTREKLRA